MFPGFPKYVVNKNHISLTPEPTSKKLYDLFLDLISSKRINAFSALTILHFQIILKLPDML